MSSSPNSLDIFVDRFGIEFVRIPPGKFMMGSSIGDMDADENEGPALEKIIEYPFYLGRFPVTLKQYRLISSYNLRDYSSFADEHAVNFISFNEACAFVSSLNTLCTKADGVVYRLPTEAQWEYACRAGTTTRFYYGDDPNYALLDEYAWFSINAWDMGLRSPQPVGQKRPNPFGLYDMHGNVWEWTSDGWASYESIIRSDENVRSHATKVLRGGAWCHEGRYIRTSDRDHYEPNYRHYYTGFRLCLERSHQ